MGCKVSTVNQCVKTENKNTALNILDPEFNPRIPLTLLQKINIVRSWKGIAKNIEQTGLLMFLRLFENNLEVRSMFAAIKGTTTKYSNSSLRDSLEDHIKMVMYVLTETMSSLEDDDAVIQNLHHVGLSHRRLQSAGFDPTIFWKIEEPFLQAVKETLGNGYNPIMAAIYRKAIQFIISTLIEGFNGTAQASETEPEST